MKFLHIADLHIGKIVNDFSMLEDQKFILEQIKEILRADRVQGLLIAGDVYDRAIPPAEAVTLFNHFLTEVSEMGVGVFLISGNHDSPERISFGEDLLCKADVHIAGVMKEDLTVVRIPENEGEVQVALLPFMKPAQVGVKTTQEAVEKVLAEYWRKEKEQEERLQEKHKAEMQTGIRRILLTHYFVTDAGREPELSDSETTVHVGGLDNVDASVLQGFDYVALGHIHKSQQIGDRPIWYAGSLLKYSFGETNQTKYALLVTIEEGKAVEVEKRPLCPLREMRRLTGTLQELMESPRMRTEYAKDYIQAILTDQGELIDPIGTLRSAYPNIMQIVRQERAAAGNLESMDTLRRRTLAAKKETDALFAAFYQEVRGEELSGEGRQIITELIKELEG